MSIFISTTIGSTKHANETQQQQTDKNSITHGL